MVQLGYILLTLLMTCIILFGYNYGLTKIETDKSTRKKRIFILGIGLILWFTYAFILSKIGVLQNLELPPRFPILLILPAFLFIGIVLFKHRNSKIINVIPSSWLIYYQGFRVFIELLFAATVAIGTLHPEVTFNGYNYDILFAFTAPVVAFLVFNKKVLSKKIALIWNYIGLGVIAFIIFLFITTIFIPSIWGSTQSLVPIEFISFPYLLVPSFLMPSAIFMHILSIVQLSKKKIVH